MGAGHGHRLHFHGHSPVHRAPAHLKVLALLGFMLVVVATPRQAYPVFALWAAVLLGVVVLSRVPPRYLLPRMVVEVPFVVFAVLMPFIAHGPRTEVLGVSVSEPGGVWSAGMSGAKPCGTEPGATVLRMSCTAS